ncbi:MAG: 4-hydroxy-tetrahydrodipicolinate reductase [Candidatus Omnitrophota bacterium]
MIRLAVSGACGRMGERIIALAKLDRDFKLCLALEYENHPGIGVSITDQLKVSAEINGIKNADCLIEFTTPESTLLHLNKCQEFKVPIVIGTTALTEDQIKEIASASRVIPVVFSPNMSVGVNLLFSLVEEAAQVLKYYPVGIREAHHLHKKDAPSGTAKKIAQIIKQVSSKEVSDIRSVREGEIIGDHEVIFENNFDTLKISHHAKTRDIFAAGALTAVKWLVVQRPGFYSMKEVIFAA